MSHGQQRVWSRSIAPLALIVGAGLCAPLAAQGQTVPLAGWRQTFADEFEGTALDLSRWNVANGPGLNNAEAEYYSPANVGVAGGALRITSEQRNIGGRAYASGNITTAGKFAQAYGRFEMRAKLPGTQGIWPAFWMLRDSGGWPPEIDIMEMLGHQPWQVYFTNHWGVYPTSYSVDSKSFAGPDFSADYHTFAVEWSPNRLEFFVDGVKRATNTGGVPTEPFYMILNTAVGGNWPGYPNASTVFPQYFDVKYVRAYTRTLYNPGFDNYGVSNSAPLDGWTAFGNASSTTTISRAGGTAAKLATISGAPGTPSGLFQDTPARPGDRWRATAWWYNPTSAPLTGDNRCATNIEWINASGGVISFISGPAIDAQSPRDVWIPAMVEGVAPPGTVSARLVLLYSQPATAPGTALVDDTDFQRLAVNTTMDDRGSAGTTALSGWTPFGSAALSLNYRRSASTSARLTGRNIAGGSTSGIYQDFAARPGQVWQASAWWLHPASDRLTGGNTTHVNIEWLDSGKRNLSTSSAVALSAASPTDVFTSASNTAVAPTGAVWARLALNFSQPALASGSAYVEDASLIPLLVNATFEDFGPTDNEPLYGWVGFGNRFGDARLVRTGAKAAKLFGTFTSSTGFSQPSGISQTFIASAGQRWRASAYFAHLADDRLVGGNTASLQIEWLNSSGGVLRTDSVVGLTAASPTGTYLPASVDAVAPAGTTRARLTLLFVQTGFSAGAALIDDVMLEPLSACGAPVALDAPSSCACSAADLAGAGFDGRQADGVVDGSDFVAFINSFAIGDVAVDGLADLNADGVIDGGDFVAFINAFALGC